MVSKIFNFIHFYVDALVNIHLLQIFIDLKTVFISWNMILKLKSFISDRNCYISEENSHRM